MRERNTFRPKPRVSPLSSDRSYAVHRAKEDVRKRPPWAGGMRLSISSQLAVMSGLAGTAPPSHELTTRPALDQLGGTARSEEDRVDAKCWVTISARNWWAFSPTDDVASVGVGRSRILNGSHRYFLYPQLSWRRGRSRRPRVPGAGSRCRGKDEFWSLCAAIARYATLHRHHRAIRLAGNPDTRRPEQSPCDEAGGWTAPGVRFLGALDCPRLHGHWALRHQLRHPAAPSGPEEQVQCPAVPSRSAARQWRVVGKRAACGNGVLASAWLRPACSPSNKRLRCSHKRNGWLATWGLAAICDVRRRPSRLPHSSG